jgi:hypothetical protein
VSAASSVGSKPVRVFVVVVEFTLVVVGMVVLVVEVVEVVEVVVVDVVVVVVPGPTGGDAAVRDWTSPRYR